jgi:hypothetical protein
MSEQSRKRLQQMVQSAKLLAAEATEAERRSSCTTAPLSGICGTAGVGGSMAVDSCPTVSYAKTTLRIFEPQERTGWYLWPRSAGTLQAQVR